MRSANLPKLKNISAGITTVLIVFASIITLVSTFGAAQTAKEEAAAVDTSGHIHLPSDYRLRYQFLGSWSVAADTGQGAKEMHVVYASPGAAEAFRSNKDFPERHNPCERGI
jgi:hypothetical protein